MILAGLGVMAPFESGSKVQVLCGGYGLALFAGCTLVKLWETAPFRRLVRVILVLAVLLEGAQFVQDSLVRKPVRNYTWQESRKESFEGVGAVARALQRPLAVSHGELGVLMLSDLVGVRIFPGWEPTSPSVLVNESVVLCTNEPMLRQVFGAENHIKDNSLAVMRGRRIPDKARPRGETVAPRSAKLVTLGTPIPDLAPGFYALGIYSEPDESTLNLHVEATDGCGRLWTIDTDTGSADVHVTTILVREGCQTLYLSHSGAGFRLRPDYFLSPLPEPTLSLWAEPNIERRLNVGISKSGHVPGLYDTPPIQGK